MERRRWVVATAATLLCGARTGWAQEAEPESASDGVLEFPDYPDPDDIEVSDLFGGQPPSEAARELARRIVAETPQGPRPLDVAMSFVERFADERPELISQWPAPAAWNPLIVEFFTATGLRATSDMVPWCAAFVNWCLERSGRVGSRSAYSQSFSDPSRFPTSDQGRVGDIAVFTGFEPDTERSLGFGHVGFVAGSPTGGRVAILGGNQSSDRQRSTISLRSFRTAGVRIARTFRGARVAADLRLSHYVTVS